MKPWIKRSFCVLALLIISAVLASCCCLVSTVEESNGADTSFPAQGYISRDESTEASDKAESVTESEAESATESEAESAVGGATESTAESKEESSVESSTFMVHFIDVGQADAALVECDGHYMLIDGGNKADSSVIYSVLKKAEVTKLDIVVGTHAHEDHIGGLSGAFNYTTADITLCPVKTYTSDIFADFAKYANQKGGGITVPRVGDSYPLGSATVKILGVNGGSDTNNSSIVLKIQYGATSFLFTGDAERDAEQAVLNSGADLSATVLKVGHHGSDTSTSYVFLRAVMPEYAVISVGAGNSYGHPTEEVLSRLRDADVKTFRTDMQGDVYCVSDGKAVTFSVKRNPNADTLANAGGGSNYGDSSTADKNDESKPEVDADVTYVLNTNTKKFHYPSCSSAEQISESNRKEVNTTRDELIAQGYSPCGRCDP